MAFSTVVFLLYFLPAVLVLYYTAGAAGIGLRNLLLLLASLLFYAWGEPARVAVLGAGCILNWVFAGLISRFKTHGTFFLAVGCVVNLGILIVFRYLNFAVGSLQTLVGAMGGRLAVPVPDIMLLAGVSFFTLRALSYLFDVYRGKAGAQKNPVNVALYISLFPLMAVGPVVRFEDMEKQILGRKHSFRLFSEGTARFVKGLGKSVLLANMFAVIADNVFAMTMAGHQLLRVPVLLAWTGLAAFSLQIFYVFSGCSDMASGLGAMFGFTFKEDYDYPYAARSVGEFWKRWYMTLNTWFREYVYVPLGGAAAKNPDLMVRNLLILCVASGLWYGAGWMFICWALFHFLLLLAERLFRIEAIGRIPDAVRRFGTLLAITLGWVLFRSENFYQYWEYMRNLFGLNHNGWYSSQVPMFFREFALVWITGLLLCFPLSGRLRAWMAGHKKLSAFCQAVLWPVGMLAIFLISIIFIARGGYEPIWYFRA